MHTVVRQHIGYDFLRVRVEHQVQLTPRPMFRPTVFLGNTQRPQAGVRNTAFAFAEHFQAGAVDNDVDFTPIFTDRNGDAQFFRPLAQRSVIRDGQVKFHDLEHSTSEAFGAAIRQLKHFPHRQQRFDGQVAENKRASLTLFEVFVLPLCEDFAGKPERDVVARLINASLSFAQFLILNAVRASVLMIRSVLRWFLMVLTNLTTPNTEKVRVCAVFFLYWGNKATE